MDKKELGYLGENAVCNYLITKGYKILKRNFCIRGGEIDIIAVKDDIISFIEVKTRKPDSMVSGLDAVTKSKQKLIIKTAAEFLVRNAVEMQPRFDVAEVILDGNNIPSKIRFLENAFDTSGYNIFI